MEKVLLIGGGGHCASVIDSMKRQALDEPVGILDVPDRVGDTVQGVPVVGVDDDMADHFDKGVKLAFVTLGSIGSTKLREKLQKKTAGIGFHFPIVNDPSAIVATDTVIGEGTFVGKGVILNTNVSVGKHGIINTGVIVDHDSQVGDFVHLAPGTTLSGSVTIGDRTHIGTNSTLIQDVMIGDDTLIGAGSVVLKNIGSGKKAYGNPCKEAKV